MLVGFPAGRGAQSVLGEISTETSAVKLNTDCALYRPENRLTLALFSTVYLIADIIEWNSFEVNLFIASIKS